MNELTGWWVAGALGAAVVAVAFLARASLVRRAQAPGAGATAFARLRAVWALLVPAVTVLLLSWPALAACGWHGGFREWAAAHDTHVRAWFAFWWLVLLIDGFEFAARLVFAWRGRPFPVPRLIRDILHAALVAGALLLVVKSVLGRDISTALASTALLTAVVGFALQGVLGNLLAGMSLHIVRATVPGDCVAVGDLEGEVLETNWRETRLRTVDGHLLVVPNSKVAEAVIHNMSRPTPLRRVRIAVGASYSDAPAAVIEALVEAARGVAEVLPEPAPQAVLTAYKDYGIDYELRLWTDRYLERSGLVSQVQCRIWYQFKRRGIEIPFPMSDKLLNDFMEVVYRQRTLPPAESEVERHLEALRHSEFGRAFLTDAGGEALIDDEALRPVARMLRRVRYTRGEVLFRQGEAGESAYVLSRGEIAGTVEFEAAMAPHTFRVAPGALLGEMSLVTGLPRTATLRAEGEVEVLEIPKAAFVRLLAVREDLPARLAELVARRAAQNAASYEQVRALPRAGLRESLQPASILGRFMRMLSFKG